MFSNEEVRTLSALAECRPWRLKRRGFTSVRWMWKSNCAATNSSVRWACWRRKCPEIRNPLTVMKMLYHSMELDFAEGDPRAEDARVLDEKMNHLDQIVDNIVKFARNAEPQMGPVDIPDLLDDLSLLTRHKLQHQQITLVREDAPDLPPVKGDATQLSQAFLNLILNAAEAMQHGENCR